MNKHLLVCCGLAAAALSWSVSAWSAQNAKRMLSADEAVRRSLAGNMLLQRTRLEEQKTAAALDMAALWPAWQVELASENIPITGLDSGVGNLESVLTLRSRIPLGGKRQAAIQLQQQQLQQSRLQTQLQAIALVEQVLTAFVRAQVTQRNIQLSMQVLQLHTNMYQTMEQRLAKGASSKLDLLQAQAQVIDVELELSRLRTALQQQLSQLTALWATEFQSAEPAFDTISSTRFSIGAIPAWPVAKAMLNQSPAYLLQLRAGEVAQATSNYARSRQTVDLDWFMGLRHFYGSEDVGVNVGVSVPLFAAKKYTLQYQQQLLSEKQAGFTKTTALLEMQQSLQQSYSDNRIYQETVTRLERNLLPIMAQLLEQSRQGYERGRYRYTDWVEASQSQLETRKRLIEAQAHLTLSEIRIHAQTGSLLSQLSVLSYANNAGVEQ